MILPFVFLAAAVTGGAYVIGASATAALVIGIAAGYNAYKTDKALRDLAKRGGSPSRERQTTNVKSSIEPARFVYGEVRTGGVLAYVAESGDDCWIVLTLSEGACDSVTGLYIDGDKQNITRSNAGVITIRDGKYSGRFTAYEEFAADGGTSTTGQGLLRAASGGEWTTNMKMTGKSYAIVKLTKGRVDDEEVYSRIPEISFVMKGRKISWPGQSSAIWTDNAAAVAWNYLRERKGIPAADIDETAFRAAYTLCETLDAVQRPNSDYVDWDAQEKRYSFNGVIYADDAPDTVMRETEFAMMGDIFEFDGKFFIEPGRDFADSEFLVIGDSDFADQESPPQIVVQPPISERFNVAEASIHQSKYHDFKEYAMPEFVDQTQLTRDGERLETNLGRRIFVNSPSAIRRLTAIEMREGRTPIRATFRLSPGRNMRFLAVKPSQPIKVTHTAAGLENWLGKVTSISIGEDFSVTITAKEYAAGTYLPTDALGQLPGRKIRAPRVNESAGSIAANDVTAIARPRAGGGGTIYWKVTVTVPSSALGFSANLLVPDLDLHNSTDGNTLEFDLDTFRTGMRVEVYRVSKAGLPGPKTTVTIAPEYEFLTLPTPVLDRPTSLVQDNLRVVTRDTNNPIVSGAEFRYTFLAIDVDGSPGTLTAATWGTGQRLDAQTLLLQPGSPGIFNLRFVANGKYRIYARYVDSVGRLGPVGEIGLEAVLIPEAPSQNIGGGPTWPGTLNHMHRFNFVTDVPLLPIPAGAPSAVTVNQWDGYDGETDVPDSYEARWRVKGETDWGTAVSIPSTNSEYSITGLTNGTIYEAELRRIDDGNKGPAHIIDFKPTASAVVPVKPDVVAAGRTASIQVHSTVHEEDERSPITSHSYRIATSTSALSSEAWKTVADSADPDVTFIITGLSASTTYYLQTRAGNSTGNGAASDVVTEQTAGGRSFGSWTRTQPSISVQSGLNANDLTTEGVFTIYNSRDGASNFPETTNNLVSAVGVLVFVEESETSQTQLSSRLDSFSNFQWIPKIRTRIRANSSAAWGNWSAWTTVSSASPWWAADANTAITRKAYFIRPSTAANAPTLHRTDINANPVIMMNSFDAGTGSISGQAILYEHFGVNRYARTVTGGGSFTLGAPSKPTLTATAPTYGNSIDLAATIAQDNGSPVSKWEYAFDTTIAGLGTADWLVADDAIGDRLDHQITNLSAGTLYYFKTRCTNELGTSAVSDRASATTSSVASYLGYGDGSSAEPYRIDPSDFSVSRPIYREMNANNRSAFSYSIGTGSVSNVAAVIQFEQTGQSNGSVTLALTNSTRAMDMRVYSGTTLLGSSTGSGNSETVTWTSGAAGTITILLISSGSASYATNTALQMNLAASDEGAGGASSDSGEEESSFPPPRQFTLSRFGSSGVAATWRAPAQEERTLLGHRLDFKAATGADWAPMADLPADATSWTERGGVADDAAWRIRSEYEGGESEWIERSVIDLWSDGASALAAGDPVDYTVLTNNASAKLRWSTGSDGPGTNFWPFGLVSGESQTFNSTTSTFYQTPIVAYDDNRSGYISADYEAYTPKVASGSSGASQDAGILENVPSFEGAATENQVWMAGAEIIPVASPAADTEYGSIDYGADGLPRGVHLGGGRISGTPEVSAGTYGVARLSATSESGAADWQFFAWTAVGALEKAGGNGSHGDPIRFRKGAGIRDIRDDLRNGQEDYRSIRSNPAASEIPTWVQVSVPAGETWDLRVTADEDFDMAVKVGDGFDWHVTGERTEATRLVNETGRAKTFKVAVVKYGETDPSLINRNGEGDSKPPVTLDFAPAMNSGSVLEEEWDAIESGASAQNITGEFEADLVMWTGTSANDLAVTTLTKGGQEPFTSKSNFRGRIHVKKSRNRALRSVLFSVQER